MSVLKTDAIKELLLEDDILSESGRIQQIWENFTSSASNDAYINIITESINNNIISHLYLYDKEYIPAIESLNKLVYKLNKSGLSNNELTTFLSVLENILIDYIPNKSIIFRNSNNIRINTLDTVLESYQMDWMVIISTMLETKLLDPNEVQGLLDNQFLELKTTANNLVAICSESESPSDGSRGIQYTFPLSAQDFGTDESKILECVKAFVMEDTKLFPNSMSEITNTIFSQSNFDNQVLYKSQDNCISNLASYDVLSSTAKYVEQSLSSDRETSIYLLSNLMNQILEFMDELEKPICLLLYMAVGLTLINKIDEFDDELKIGLRSSVKKELANAFSMYEKEKGSNGDYSKMIQIPEKIKKFVSLIKDDKSFGSINCSNDSDNIINLKADIEEIISDMDEVKETMDFYGIPTEKVGGGEQPVATLESAVNSDIQGSKVRVAKKPLKLKVEEYAMEVHNELNRSLMEGNFELAAEQIALEVALVKQFDDHIKESVFETIGRDITTYMKIIDSSSSGVSFYKEKSQEKVTELLNR